MAVTLRFFEGMDGWCRWSAKNRLMPNVCESKVSEKARLTEMIGRFPRCHYLAIIVRRKMTYYTYCKIRFDG